MFGHQARRFGGRGSGRRAGPRADPGHGDVVQHGFGAVGREGRHNVHPLGLQRLGLSLVELAQLHKLAGFLDQHIIDALAGSFPGGGVADLISLTESSRRGGNLVRVVAEEAVAQFPALDLLRDGLRLIDLVICQGGTRLTEQGVGVLAIMGQRLSRLARAGEILGPLLVQVGADLGRCVVEQAPLDVDGLGLGDLLFGRVKIALGHLFPGFVQQPDGVLLDVGSDGHVAGSTAGWVPGLNNTCGRRVCLHGGRGHRRARSGHRRVCLHGGRGHRRVCLHGGRGHRRARSGLRRGCLHGGRGHRRAHSGLRRVCLHGGRGHRRARSGLRRVCLHGGRGHRRARSGLRRVCLHGGRGHRRARSGLRRVCLHGGRGHRRARSGLRRACSVGCGRSSRGRGANLGEFPEIRIEHGLFVLLKLIAVHLGSSEILCGQLEIPAVEKPGSSFEIPDRRHWRGLACRRRWRRDRVIGRCTLPGRSPCADDQDDSERTEPSQRDLLSPPRGQPPTSLMAALLNSPRRETLFGAYA